MRGPRQRQRIHWVLHDVVSRDGVDLYWCPKAHKFLPLAEAEHHVLLSRRFKTLAACQRAANGLSDLGCRSYIATQWTLRRGRRWSRSLFFKGAERVRGEECAHWLPPR